MTLKLLLVLCAILNSCFAQSISCNYITRGSDYICDLKTENPTGFDSFLSIEGFHEPGRTNLDVTQVIATGHSTIIPRIICDTFTNLQSFTFQRMGVTFISDVVFSRCTNVRIIDISDNSIQQVGSLFLNWATQLRWFSIANQNRTASFAPSSWFSQTRLIEHIDISGMSWTNFAFNFFVNNIELRSVRMGSNRFSTWDTRFFANNPNLKRVDLSNNQFSTIPRDAFHIAHQLEYFNINNNFVGDVRLDTFRNVNSLTDLHLAGNVIGLLDRALMDAAVNLNNLDMAGNRCIDRTFTNFSENRDVYMEELRGCILN